MSTSLSDLPPVNTVLAFGAHPDDLEFGCGGILLALQETSWAVHLVVASRGESGSNGTPEVRTMEAEAAAEQLRATLHWCDFGGDAHMEKSVGHVLAAARWIREIRPTMVLAPTTVATQHPDHVVVGQVVRDAVRLARYGKVSELMDMAPWAAPQFYQYAISPSAEPTGINQVIVDVSSVGNDWKRLMLQHASQMATRDYSELQLTRARALGMQANLDLAQALYSEDLLILSCPVDLPATQRLI